MWILRNRKTEEIEVALSAKEFHELMATNNYIFLRYW